jgi:hypothetical protein
MIITILKSNTTPSVRIEKGWLEKVGPQGVYKAVQVLGITNQKRLASDHNKNDRSIDRHIWPKYGIPLPLWLYISSASSGRKSHTVMIIEIFFSSAPLKVNSIQNGRPIRTKIQTSTIDMKNTTKYCFILYIMMSGDVHYNPGVCSMYFPGSHQNQYCYFRLMYSEKTNQKRWASNHSKDDRSIDRHIWPTYGIPLPLWLYISSASRRLHPRNFLAAHLNINSYRYKFDEIKELLSDKIVDIFFVVESKLDATFNKK